MDQDHTGDALAFQQRRRRPSAPDTDQHGTRSRPNPSKSQQSHPAAQDAASQADPDTCRICRGDGTPEEPLFYPCKCSGSIKYVHQDCLMEWLSHSQKKHCELCKTPFRFTKLYAPNMPKTVPAYVFVSHIAKYIFRNMLGWARAALVLMVWLVWLPYLMRRVWSALFWLSDEGLPVWGRPDASAAMGSVGGSVSGTATCPSSPLSAETTTAASLQGIMSRVPTANAQTTTSLYGINITTDNPLSNILLNMFLGSFYLGGPASQANVSAEVPQMAATAPTPQPTLLSDIKFLQKLCSSSPALGGFAVDVLEGQIITVLVIVCFILIILVRDYVVQQQPDINMRAAFAAADNPVPADDVAPPAQVIPARIQLNPTEGLETDDIDRLPGPEQEDGGVSTQAQDENTGERGHHWPLNDLRQRPSAGNLEPAAIPTAEVSQSGSSRDTAILSHDGSGAAEKYVRIYRQAQGDVDEVRRIAREENLEDELAYFLGIGQAQTSRNQLDSQAEEGGSSASNEWRPASGLDWPEDDPKTSGKGKSPVADERADSGDNQSHSRRRSATDGPQRVGGVNPLGHNNWSYADPSRGTERLEPSEPAPRGPVPDLAASTAQWSYMTPPSSTLAESASSSVHGRTPSSSSSDDFANNPVELPHQDALDAVSEADRAVDWEAISEFDAQLEEQRHPDAPTEELRARDHPQPAGFTQRVADFMWRDVDAIPPHELPPVLEPADDFFDHEQDPVLAIAENQIQQPQEQDQEVVAAAAAAGIDAEAEAIEDEDLEGILELLGMRGPIAGLFQNALFCAFLVSITLFIGVFLPYNMGRVAIWVVANPIRPIRAMFSVSKLIQDCAMLVVGFASTFVFGCFNGIVSFFRPETPQLEVVRSLVERSWFLMENAGGRLRDSGIIDFSFVSTEDLRHFSIASHAALLTLKSYMATVIAAIGEIGLYIFGGKYSAKLAELMSQTETASSLAWQGLKDLPSVLSNPSSWVIDLGAYATSVPSSPELASWSAMDRLWAILGGYVAMCVATAFYLGRGTPIAGRLGQEWEATFFDVLVQASGVMKVILIIGIEMLIFPLYCGLLLDVALLPLFEDTTIMSRAMFTVNFPLTSIFVHWFVGTGYMFHFALFVSMCRKIMRKGVLCK